MTESVDDRFEPKADSVGSLLHAVVADLGIGGKIEECEAILAWEAVAGEALAAQAKAVGVRQGRLQLAVSSSVWRTHLSFSKQQLLERINQRLGKKVLKDLVFVSRR